MATIPDPVSGTTIESAWGQAVADSINGPELGSGDTNLYRAAANLLATDDGLRVGHRLRLAGIISPTALSGDVDDYSPAGIETASIVRLSSDATPRTITGIQAGANGDVLILQNLNGSTAILLADESGSSLGGNRIICPGAGSSVVGGGGALLIYDGIGARWRLIALAG